MMTNFDLAFNYVFQNEGGFVDNPDDRGGPTKFGITIKTFETFFTQIATVDDIWNLTSDQAKMIYDGLYWKVLGCDNIVNPAYSIAIFDTGVLYGTGNSALLTQSAIESFGYDIKCDGILGDKSVGLLNALSGPKFLDVFHGLVLKRIDSVILARPENEVFRTGWVKRADRLLTLNDNDFLMKLSLTTV